MTRPSENILKMKFCSILFLIFFLSLMDKVSAQEVPPRPIEVSMVSGISFGAFSHTSGGTITIDANTADGNRTTAGSIVPLGMGIPVRRACFSITGNAGTIVNLSFNPNVSLGILSMIINSTNPGVAFPLQNQYPLNNIIYLGGTLNVGPGSPAGTYSGTFTIDFIQNWE